MRQRLSISFSGGRSSAVMLHLTYAREIERRPVVVAQHGLDLFLGHDCCADSGQQGFFEGVDHGGKTLVARGGGGNRGAREAAPPPPGT